MTVFAIFTYTEFFKHKSAEGEKMDKKLRVLLLTSPGLA